MCLVLKTNLLIFPAFYHSLSIAMYIFMHIDIFTDVINKKNLTTTVIKAYFVLVKITNIY